MTEQMEDKFEQLRKSKAGCGLMLFAIFGVMETYGVASIINYAKSHITGVNFNKEQEKAFNAILAHPAEMAAIGATTFAGVAMLGARRFIKGK